jgi:hypothetical protein
MQISNNYQASPNFGRLAIQTKAVEKLRSLPIKTLNELEKAGDLLQGTRFFDVKIDEDLSAKLVSTGDPYFGVFKGKEYIGLPGQCKNAVGEIVSNDNVVMINTPHGNPLYGVGKCGEPTAKEQSYNIWTVRSYNKIEDVPVIAKIAKILDDVAVLKKIEAERIEEVAKKAQVEVNTKVNDILSRFGVK